MVFCLFFFRFFLFWDGVISLFQESAGGGRTNECGLVGKNGRLPPVQLLRMGGEEEDGTARGRGGETEHTEEGELFSFNSSLV